MSTRDIQRVRHDLRFRTLTVAAVQDLTPSLRRVVLEGPELDGFVSLGFDDHVKIFPAAEGEAAVLPTLGPDGPIFPEPRPAMRDYTPRAFDPTTNRLTLDFVTGHGGPATEWAMAARPGATLGVGGPRGSFVVPTDYADHVLIGDETALPAIARRLEELPPQARAHAVIEVGTFADRIALDSPARATVTWAMRDGAPRGESQALLKAAETALAGVDPTDAYVWIAAEATAAKALRARAIDLGFSPKAMKAAGYWRLDTAGGEKISLD